MRWPAFTTAHYSAIVATLALLFSGVASVYVAWQNYELSALKDRREVADKEPSVDLQIRPNQFASSADMTVAIINRSDINVAPIDITVLHSFDFGEFYLSGGRQSVDDLKSWLSLSSMGSIAPKATATMKAKVSGVTDGKDDSFKSGVELQFAVRIRLGDNLDTVKTFNIVRHVKR